MSDSLPKLRSPIATYGPIIIPVVGIGVALVVLFTLGSGKPSTGTTPAPESTPPAEATKAREAGERAANGDPDAARAEAKKLMKTRGPSWFDLKQEDQRKLDQLTHGSGRIIYETIVNEERAKTPKK